MKKLPLRIRLIIITSLVIVASCLIITFCVLNSAIMKIDSIEAGMIDLSPDENTEIVMNIQLSEVFPELNEYLEAAKSDFIKQSILITLMVMLFGAIASFFASMVALKPIRQLSDAVEKTTEHNLPEPLHLPEPKDEVRKLAESFNTMKERLAGSFASQKRFSANAAHELRTPLAVMQTELEVFQKKDHKTMEEYDSVVASTLTQLERMNQMVETLLTFQSLHTLPTAEEILLADLVEEISMDLQNLAQEKNVDLTCQWEEAAGNLSIKGNLYMIYRAIYNLIENAIKYNHEGGSVSVFLRKDDSYLTVEIADTGQGIPEEQWDKIFEAFYRVDKSRSRQSGGTGLGLALVKEIAEVHKGKVWVKESDENGSTLCFSLPTQ